MITKSFLGFPTTFGWRNRYDEFDYLWRRLNNLVGQDSGAITRAASPGVFPLVNLTETTDNYYLRAELPGVRNDALDIQSMSNSLTISGKRTLPEEGADATFHRKERDSGKFSRIVKIPGNIDNSKIAAELKNGILTITIPKAEEAKPKQIAVK